MTVNRNGKWHLIVTLTVFGLTLISNQVEAGDLDFSASRSGGYAHRSADSSYAGGFGAWTERLGLKQDEEGGANQPIAS